MVRGTRLDEVMIEAGLVTAEYVAAVAAADHDLDGARLIRTAALDGYGTEESIARSLAASLGLPFADLAKVSISPHVLKRIPRPLASRYGVIALEEIEGGLVVAVADPTDLVTIDDLRTATGIGRMAVAVAAPEAILETLDRAYATDAAAGEVLEGIAEPDPVEIMAEPRTEIEDLASLEQAAHQGPIVTLVNALLTDALRGRATDIHIEPHRDDVLVRHRVDGHLREAVRLPRHMHPLIVSRLKIISGMDITERRRPQDGRSRIVLNGKEIASRMSTLPSHLGEKMVVRLLMRGKEVGDLSAIGLEADQETILREHLAFPHGLIVFTGPTGAGKTSTMYASLSHVRTPEKNVVSVEDPIEYEIEGVTQVQIEEKGGVTFPSGLRSILRQDPDVIMVGEIRDLETAQMVSRAAVTGHLVLSSLHTNDAASAIGRLTGLGLEPYQIAGSLTLVVAQRLVRTICEGCKTSAEVDPRVAIALGLDPRQAAEMHPMTGSGCAACGGTGYRGRVGIFEVLPVAEGAAENPMLRALNATGADRRMTTGDLRDNGLKKVAAGVVTLDEVLAATYRQPREVLTLDERQQKSAKNLA